MRVVSVPMLVRTRPFGDAGAVSTNSEDQPHVVAVSTDGTHRFSKPVVDHVVLIEGWGIDGDAHAGTTVQHRSRVARDPSQPNLRQVHLLHAELFDEVADAGFDVAPGQMGENITTRGIDLLGLPTGALLHIGADACVRVTGLRNPCQQINGFEPGLLRAVLGRAQDGSVERKGGVMGVVVAGGTVRAGDTVRVELPVGERTPLAPV
ncbi:MOSC domain-containing protein YiiM [Curtobacterium sp. PhB130]|nr:MOSC domain-containing protein YiiM [Curtobacterium sp. PhB130]